MKNILIIDGAENCTYDVFQADDEEFLSIFGDKEVVFIEEITSSQDMLDMYDPIFSNIWKRPIDKRDAAGIHGTIFYEQYYKKKYFPNGKWCEKVKF